LWSEFIAQHYALIHTESRKPSFAMAQSLIFDYICEVTARNDSAKDFLAQTFARLINCSDFEETLARIENDPKFFFVDDAKYGVNARKTFLRLLSLLRGQLRKEEPWTIHIGLMVELGEAYMSFLAFNSIFLSEM
jgi:hypothetical protein